MIIKFNKQITMPWECEVKNVPNCIYYIARVSININQVDMISILAVTEVVDSYTYTKKLMAFILNSPEDVCSSYLTNNFNYIGESPTNNVDMLQYFDSFFKNPNREYVINVADSNTWINIC